MVNFKVGDRVTVWGTVVSIGDETTPLVRFHPTHEEAARIYINEDWIDRHEPRKFSPGEKLVPKRGFAENFFTFVAEANGWAFVTCAVDGVPHATCLKVEDLKRHDPAE